MISIYLRPDKTQIVRGKKKKNNTLVVDTALELPSYWDCFTGGQPTNLPGQNFMEYQGSQELRKLFQAVKEVTSTKYEEVYLVIADTIFSMVNVFPYVAENMMMDAIAQKLGSLDEYYLSMPMEVKPPQNKRKTVYAIRRKYIDRIVQAAQAENITLTGIEPASMGFVRSMQKYGCDYAFVEMFKKEATIITFSPIGGIYRNDAPHMGEDELISRPEDADRQITSNFSTNNFIGGSFFGSISPDLPYYVLSDNPDIYTIPAIRHNEPRNPVGLPLIVEANITEHDQINWMIVIGTLLQTIEAEAVVYPDKDDSLIIHAANLLPEELQTAAKQRQWKAVAKRTFKGLAIGFVTLICVEMAGIVYFGSITVDPKLQADYEQAKADKVVIDVEMNSLKACLKDDPHVVEAYERLLRNRPSGCGFSQLSIGSKDTNNKDMNAKFIKVRAISNDQIAFNDFVAALQQEDVFQSPTVNSISGTQGVMTADINIGRKGSDGK